MDTLNINLKELYRVIWKEKWLIIAITSVITLSGVAYALLAREEFGTHGKILPEVQGKGGSLGQFSGLAAIAGIDLSTMSGYMDAVRPDLYADVINSTPFFLSLLKHEVHTKENRKLTFDEFYHEIFENGKEVDEEDLIKYPVKEDGITLINLRDEYRLRSLKERINAVFDKKTGVITIYTLMPDPVVAAEVTKFAMEYLVDYVKNYRTQKMRQEVEYLKHQLDQSQKKYYSTQETKAKYSDEFRGMMLQSADIKRERLDLEYKISSTFYNEILKKYEEAQFKLHQETPVFAILEPPVAPAEKTKPRRTLIVLACMFFGGVLSTAIALIRKENYKLIFPVLF